MGRLYELCPFCKGTGLAPFGNSPFRTRCKHHQAEYVVEIGATSAQLEAAINRAEQASAVLSAAKRLWADRDATQDDPAACRRLDNAWKDLGDALALTSTGTGTEGP